MRIIVADNYLHMSEIAADMIAEIVKQKPDCVLICTPKVRHFWGAYQRERVF